MCVLKMKIVPSAVQKLSSEQTHRQTHRHRCLNILYLKKKKKYIYTVTGHSFIMKIQLVKYNDKFINLSFVKYFIANSFL